MCRIEKITFLILSLFTGFLTNAQQEASFSLYMFNHQLINPAYVGATTLTQFTAETRNQWEGIPGAPESHAFSVSHLIKNKNFGLGVSGISDNIGPTERNNMAIDLAYHLRLNEAGLKLGIGLKLSSRSLNFNNSILTPISANDPSLMVNYNNEFSPNLGFGFYLQNKSFYFGGSIPYFFEDEDLYLNRNTYFIGGVLISLNSSLQLKPSMLFHKMKAQPWVYDTSILLSIRNSFWLGPQYRATVKNILPNQNSAGFFGAIAGLNLSKSTSIAYAYQGRIGNRNFGITNTSHEILLRIQLRKKEIGFLRSPRLF